MVVYKPQRDSRFEYIWDLMQFIEERQCERCSLKSDRPEYPMCFEIEAEILDEKPVADLDDRGEYGVVCTRYVDEVLAEEAHQNQLRLF